MDPFSVRNLIYWGEGFLQKAGFRLLQVSTRRKVIESLPGWLDNAEKSTS